MKKIILLLLFSLSYTLAQDVTTSMNVYLRDTLTATTDSVRVDVGANNQNNIFTITVYTTSGTDTVNVYTLPKGYTVWTQKSLIDLSTINIVTQLIATTTAKEYLLTEPEVISILLVTPDASANTVFIVSRKSGAYSINGLTTTVGIDQTTDGTTNKVQARNATHDNFQANANIQVGDADVANGNPVPISDAGGSVTVDGTVAVSGITSSSNNYSTLFTTVGTVIDSVVFGFTTNEYTFINDGTVSDTLYVSSASNFPSTNTSKLVGTEWMTKRRAVTKLYFKVGATPLASKKIRIEAN